MKKEVSYVKIQTNLGKFIKRWGAYEKNEKTGAQTFLNEFFECFGITFDPNKLPYEKNTGKGFADCYIKGKLVLEMKDGNKVKTKDDLLQALPQAERYWKAEGKEVNYLVLCNFKSFVIYDTRDQSKTFMKLPELEKKVNAFAFLMDSSPYLLEEQEAVSRSATKTLGSFYKSLKKRHPENRIDEIDTFILQCVFCMFAEDVGFLPYGIFTNLVNKIEDGVYNSADLLTNLFKMMDEKDTARKQGSLFENVRWFNGPLFKSKPEIVLNEDELELLKAACTFDWSNIKPEIFGVLFESSTDENEKHENGMHFTSEEDILRLVKPCITDYWEEKFQSCKTEKDFRDLHSELLKYRVLDPACGSGNFLLVAYREIKRIESRIFHRLSTLTGKSYSWIQSHRGYYPVQNLYGIELKNFPTLIARVSLWITKKMMQMELQLQEPDLPLEGLNHIICADALVQKWDDVDVVVGNPPYIGCKQVRSFRGDDYFEWLSGRFKNHNKMSDYCTYWYEKVLEDLRAGVRVGLVNTNTISQNASRVASLDKISQSGGEIFDAWKDVKWSGDAQVTVSLVCFVNKQLASGIIKKLNGVSVENINTRLECDENVFDYPVINEDKASYVGVAIQGIGFTLTEEQKDKILSKEPASSEVIKRFLSGDDLNQEPLGKPSRWIVDFKDLPLEKASKFKLAIKHVIENVKPHRDKVRREAHKKYWWHYGDKRMEMREKVEPLKRILVTSNVSKYLFFQFVPKDVLPSHSCTIIAKDDYFTFGVLNSVFHDVWTWHTSSTFETRIRYSGTKSFDTFPFPTFSKNVEQLGNELEVLRKKLMKENSSGMTDLYNLLHQGGFKELQSIHLKLNKEIAKAYGFDHLKINDRGEILAFLRELNHQRSEELNVAKLIKLKKEISEVAKGRKKKVAVRKAK